MRCRTMGLAILGLLVPLASASLVNAAPEGSASSLPDKVEFNRDIRPILSDNCFTCHGFDAKKRKADLRLDTQAGILAKLEAGHVVQPGKPDASLVFQRIITKDADEIMPPPSSKKKPLTEHQQALIKKWIEQGAPYEEHWAFQPVKQPTVPVVKDAAWVRNPIDAFILARLEREGLKAGPEADRVTLIRRVTLDLTGLPPTPEEVDAFLADKSPDAYEKLVDRLMVSVRYGERMALDWLDAARYADTHGFHIDSGRDMTRWREWVIEAFTKNKRYDQFTIEQLAGDLLPDATLDQKIASGFNRNHMVNFEGGAIAEEYRTAYVIDRVNTTGTVWLGLTVACVQCHDHKYDPITQKEYYQLYALFNTITEKGLDGSRGNAAPFVAAPTAEQQKKIAELTTKLAVAQKAMAGSLPAADEAQTAWEKALSPEALAGSATWHLPAASKMESQGKATLAQQPDKAILASGRNPNNELYTVQLPIPADIKRVTGVRLEALPDQSLPAGGAGRSKNGNAVMTEFRVSRLVDGKTTPVKIARAAASFSQEKFPVGDAIDGRSETGWGLYPQTGKAHELTFELAEPIAGGEVVVELEFKSPHGQHQLGKFRLALTDALSPTGSSKLPAAVVKALAIPADKRNAPQAAAVRDYFRQSIWTGAKEQNERIASIKKELEATEQAVPTAMVMQEQPTPRETFVLVRGAYDKPGEKVTPGVPAFLPPLPKDQPANRLTFARWLVDRNHPLTSRVTVNRYWQMIFGTGLVKTSEDFGSQGELPSHKELLDWASADFMDNGWDVRRLIRQFVTSSTYRQAAKVTPDLYAHDPENRLLARGTRYRLQAELIRDQALAASGLLDGRVGGHSVSPYQPAGLWEELMSRNDGSKWTAQTYVQSKGDDLYRRTMYTFWKRTCPPPTLQTFDAPDRETCTVKRARTNTPLQALVLMNDPTYVEASRKLAERALKEPAAGATDEDRLSHAFRLVLARKPRAEEVTVLKDLLGKQRAKYTADKDAAGKLLKVGESPCDEKLNASELAAWASVCGVILNLDEAVTRG
jgi:hypothetical protein